MLLPEDDVYISITESLCAFCGELSLVSLNGHGGD